MTPVGKTWQRHAQHILVASERIDLFRRKYEALDPEAYKDILYRNLHTISESADKLPEQIKLEFHHIQWAKIKAFRNIVVHDYLGEDIDPEVVSRILSNDLPQLRQAAADMLKRYPINTEDFNGK